MTATALVLDFEKHHLHALQRGGLLWFVLVEVCNVLELEKPDRAASRLDAEQKGTHIMSTLGGPQRMTIISEDGVYDLATTSRKPIAKRFKRWLYREVLPEIRRTGSYQGGSAPLDALIGSLQPELDLSPANDALLERQRESTHLSKPRESNEKPHPSDWSASYAKWREHTIETTLPRPRNFLDAITETGHTPQGYGDSITEKPSMFMRDQLPIGHSADSWRVWVSEQWFRLPLDLRRRWWRDTNYGECAPSHGMIQAIIAIALP